MLVETVIASHMSKTLPTISTKACIKHTKPLESVMHAFFLVQSSHLVHAPGILLRNGTKITEMHGGLVH